MKRPCYKEAVSRTKNPAVVATAGLFDAQSGREDQAA